MEIPCLMVYPEADQKLAAFTPLVSNHASGAANETVPHSFLHFERIHADPRRPNLERFKRAWKELISSDPEHTFNRHL